MDRLSEIRERFEASPFHATLVGARLDRVAPDEVDVSLDVEPRHLNLSGTLHGGMIATIRALTGKNPARYFGDSSDPARPRTRDLREEARRVFRSRVTNPKWIESMRRHSRSSPSVCSAAS